MHVGTVRTIVFTMPLVVIAIGVVLLSLGFHIDGRMVLVGGSVQAAVIALFSLPQTKSWMSPGS